MSPRARALALVPLATFSLAAGNHRTVATPVVHPSPKPAREAGVASPAGGGRQRSARVDGYVVTMQLTDTAGSVNFTMRVAGDAFSLGLDDLLPLMSRGLGGSIGSLGDVASLAGNANLGMLSAGAYLLAQDSTRLVLVMPAVRMAMMIDPGAMPGGRGGRAGRGQALDSTFQRGGRGGRGGAGDPTDPRGRGRVAGGDTAATVATGRGRGARGGPPDTAGFAARGRGGRQQGFVVATDSGGAAVTVEDLGDAEPVLGHPTHKYRIHMTTPLVPGASCANAKTSDVVTEGWFATDIAGGAFSRFFSMVPMLDQAAAPMRNADSLSRKMPSGFPMKSVATCDTPAHDALISLQVIQIEPTQFDASDFAIPAGMQVLDMNARARRGGGR